MTTVVLALGLTSVAFAPTVSATYQCTDTGTNSYDCVKSAGGCVYYWTDDDENDDHEDDGAHVEHVSCPTSEIGPILETTPGDLA